MTRSILLVGAALLSLSISPLNAEASGAPWCAVNPWGDGDVDWDCRYRSIEECRPVIAGNRGFCSPSPSYVANPPELRNSRQASPMGSNTIAKSEKTIAVKKESPRHRNANARSKIVASPITVKTPRQHDKSNAKSKNSIAMKIEWIWPRKTTKTTPQPAQSDGKSNAESENSVATKIETPQPAQSDDKSNAELENSVATKIETPQSAQSDGKSNAESKNSIATQIETPQPAQSDDKSNAESENSVATKIETPQSAQSDGKSNAESKNSIATQIETPQQSDDKSKVESKNSNATKIETSQSSESDSKSNTEANMKSIAAKMETSQSSQLDDETVIKKAKVTIAAKMENPASVVFLEMERAIREIALGNSIDTICGRVRGKIVGDTADRPFVYVVQKDEAYIGAYTIATTEYRKICN
jgi:hypothetical protein